MSEEKSIPEIPYEPLSRGGSVHDRGFAYVASDPGPELVTLPEGAQVFPNAGEWVKVTDLRRFVRKEVRAALDDLAREMRTGVAFQPTRSVKQAGTCCACLTAGDDMVWVGNRLAHRDEECRRKAAEMEPVREHRG